MPRTDPIKACEDFHRTAGMRDRQVGLSRRSFISLGAAAGLSVYAARALPLAQLLEGAEAAHAAAPEAPILVTVFLPGGLDLLDSIVPLNQYDAYRSHRGALAQPETVPKLGRTGLGVHPSLTKGDRGGLKGLFEAGRIALIPGIDYANPNLSHFHSRAFWETGLITPNSTTGWMGRWLDANGSKDNPFQGLTSGYRLSPLLRSSSAPVSSVEGAKSAALNIRGVGGADIQRAMAAWSDLANPRTKDSEALAAVRRSSRLAREVADRLAPLAGPAPEPQTQGGVEIPGVTQAESTGYPANSGFADRLRQLAYLLAQPLGIRVATVDADSDFDTHHGQAPTLLRELEEISMALSAFQTDIEARGLGDRVMTLVWSEFGRRPKANESAGTDHGAGGVAWVMGNQVQAGQITEYPSLRDLDDKQNLEVIVDFRTVYASLVEQWLRTDPEIVVPSSAAFGRVKLVR